MGQHLQLPSVRFVSSPRGRVIPECRGCPECDCPLGREIAAWVLSCCAVCEVVGSVLRRCRARRKIYSSVTLCSCVHKSRVGRVGGYEPTRSPSADRVSRKYAVVARRPSRSSI